MTTKAALSGNEFTPEQWARIRAQIRARGMASEEMRDQFRAMLREYANTELPSK